MVESEASSNPAESLKQELGQGFDMLRNGRFDQALLLGEKLLAAHPEHAEVLFLASEAQLAAGNEAEALRLIDRAIGVAPGQPALLLRKAHVLLALRRRSDAREVATQAAVGAGNDARVLWGVGRVHFNCNDALQAQKYYLEALDAPGSHPSVRYDLAAAQFFSGDFGAAERNLDALLAVAPATGHALYLRSTLRRQTPQANHVAALEARLRAGFPDPVSRAAGLYALAKELEDLGDPRSFAVLREAAGTKRGSLRYDAAAELGAIEGIRTTHSADRLHDGRRGVDEAGAIFIVGMPRTGTTLVERMLGNHSKVSSAGELLDFSQLLGAAARAAHARDSGGSLVESALAVDFEALGRDYLTGARQAATDTPLFIDKMPVNFIYCGLIRKALPQARIIHLQRDPMDTCYAVYKTLFQQSYHFSYDLAELADYYIAYRRLMAHWHEVMPGVIVDLRYEDLVTDSEGQARRLLDGCGLDWQDAVLDPSANPAPAATASAAQVREPVHARSVQAWRRFEQGLAPLRARLEAAGLLEN